MSVQISFLIFVYTITQKSVYFFGNNTGQTDKKKDRVYRTSN